MRSFEDILEAAVKRKGSLKVVEALLPDVASTQQLIERSDAWYLSALVRRVFRAGMRHSVVDNRWPAFEAAFFGFDPDKLVLMPQEMLEQRMADPALIRHRRKMQSIPLNAAMVCALRQEYGGVGRWLAQWPVEDTVGLWRQLAKRGAQLGGHSGPAFLRMVGRDSWYPTGDVSAGLIASGVVDRAPTSQRDLKAAQQAFNHWQQQSGRPQAHISRILAQTVG